MMKRILHSLTIANAKTSFFLLLTVFVSLIMISPKWNIGIFSFIAYAVNLRYFRNVKMWKAALLTWFVYTCATFIANQGVMPFPAPLMLTLILTLGAIKLIPFVLDKLMFKRFPGGLSVLAFPAAAIAVEYYISHSPNGTFGNIAYTMVDINVLMQLASITGIWGVAFLIYLFASVVNHIVENRTDPSIVKRYSILYVSLFSLAVLFGFIRLQSGTSSLANAETLENYMYTEKPYLEPDLSINDLAEKLNINVKTISQVINDELGLRFFDYINKYRVQAAVSLLNNPSDPKMTISEIMYEIGFNSKSSFNTAFKKFTGKTPSDYKKN